jgi:hypothetical protein
LYRPCVENHLQKPEGRFTTGPLADCLTSILLSGGLRVPISSDVPSKTRAHIRSRQRGKDAYFPFDGVVTFTFTWRGLDSSRLGRFTVNTPFLYSARIDSGLTVFGNEKLRLKVP